MPRTIRALTMSYDAPSMTDESAQIVTLNQYFQGSSPCAPANEFNHLGQLSGVGLFAAVGACSPVVSGRPWGRFRHHQFAKTPRGLPAAGGLRLGAHRFVAVTAGSVSVALRCRGWMGGGPSHLGAITVRHCAGCCLQQQASVSIVLCLSRACLACCRV